MAIRYRSVLKWVLYSAGFLLVMLLSTVMLGDRRFWGTKLSLVPVYVSCVSCREGHEAGGFFALASALLWTLSGAEGGAVFVLMLPVAAVISGFFCNTYLTRTLLPALAGCLLALVLCEGGVYVQRVYMGAAMPPDAPVLLTLQILLSLAAGPLFWWLTRLIGKAGD